MTNTPQTNPSPETQTMTERYQRAQHLLQGIWTDNIAFNDTIYPIWIGDSDCFWYERTTKTGQGASAKFGKEYRFLRLKT